MNSIPRPMTLTSRQFAEMARKGAFDTVGRVELRNGMISLMAPVYLRHSSISSALYLALNAALSAGRSALRANIELSLQLAEDFMPTADMVLWDPACVPAGHDGPLPLEAVRLVIEVADTSLDDDLGEKMRGYARSGVTEYWVVDVRGRVIFVHAEPGEDGYRTREVVKFGEAIAARTLDLGFSTAALLNV
jgi:Uma2 family endonuclease